MAAKPSEARRTLVHAAIQQLESLQAAGLTHLPKARARARQPAATAAAAARPDGVASAPASTNPPIPAGEGEAALDEVRQRVAGCTLCAELASTRTQTVFGEGSPQARLAFLGEAPGADEDRTGRPFVGRAGQLLTRIIEACGLKREDVYIFNTLKCRPPGNRNPLPSEAANCRQYLDRQLEIIRPEFICCLGAVAAQNLLMTDTMKPEEAMKPEEIRALLVRKKAKQVEIARILDVSHSAVGMCIDGKLVSRRIRETVAKRV